MMRKPTYNPQFTQGKPYKLRRTHETSNYGDQVENETISDGRRFPTSIIDIPQKRIKDGHPTAKPPELGEYLIRTYTNEGETVLDNTMGSGSFGVAAVNTGRKFIGIEREKKYFDIAKKRIEDEVAEKEKREITPVVQQARLF